MQKKLNELPESDNEYWEGAETHRQRAERIEICSTHEKKNWLTHIGYKENKDGSISCEACPWGTRAIPYIHVKEGKAVDVRRL